jgi:hypothetical protein
MRISKLISDRFTSENNTHLLGIWVGPKAGQGIFETRKFVEVNQTIGLEAYRNALS